MNRDIVSVLLGGFGTKATGDGKTMKIEGEATMTNANDVATGLTEAGTASAPRHFSVSLIAVWRVSHKMLAGFAWLD